ncbi:trypsin inhibitor-like [Ostrinia furnacalis]|uniref:trypsin inhibitor-like n=1 Tax=Ostrinia furnacalis TaxID=93504 RepID=UPI00103ECA4C|nr:trypsin inhibitor-like [Ostrinia furnacalis]
MFWFYYRRSHSGNMKILLLLCVLVLSTVSAENPTCMMPIESGNCFGNFPRYAYTREHGCQEFVYGGCGGNNNNFKTYQECERFCMLPR